MGELIDLTGQRFGRLTVLERAENTPSGQARWLCCCNCGNLKVIRGQSLRSGITQSCGCLRQERLLAANTTHGNSNSRLYHIWCDMKRRCTDRKGKDWSFYGARGITVCQEWNEDFAAFQEWALDNGYSDELTIDRINVDEGYSPDNCRWVDALIQSRNRRNIQTYAHKGKRQAISAWADEYGLPYGVLYYRLKQGWPIARALTEPIDYKKSNK